MCCWKSPVSIQHVKDPQTLNTSSKHLFFTHAHTQTLQKLKVTYITRDGKERYEMFLYESQNLAETVVCVLVSLMSN